MAARGASTTIARLLGALAGALALANALATTGLHAQSVFPASDGFELRGAESPTDSSDAAEPAPNFESEAQTRGPVARPAANYGKPKPPADPTANYSGKAKTFAHPLPDLQPYVGAPTLRPRGGPPKPAGGADPTPNFALPAAPRRKPPTPEADPFAPTGIDVGALRFTPFVETDLGYDSNPNRVSTGAKGSPVVQTEAGFSETSLWSANQLDANLQAGYSDYLRTRQANQPNGSGNLNLRLDATRRTALDFQLRGTLSTQQPGAPGVSASLVGRPLIIAYGGTAGVTEKLSRLTLGMHALIDRAVYQNGVLSNGAIDPLSCENYTDYTIQNRAGYEITPGLTPFVEIDADTRKHDQQYDTAGYQRDSNGVAAQAGTSFDWDQLLVGSLALGYAERNYRDPRLGKLAAPIFNSSLAWSPTALTTITLKGATSINETTVAGAAGEISHAVSLGVSHALLRDLTVTGLASYGVGTYPGSSILEHDYVGTLSVQYSASRWLTLKGTYTHEKLASTNPGSSYADDLILFGVRLQR